MNIEAIRRILLMTTAEAAHLLGGVSETTWNRWERGIKPLPVDVRERIVATLARRRAYLLPMLDALRGGEPVAVSWAKGEGLDWHIQRSAHAELIALGAATEEENGERKD